MASRFWVGGTGTWDAADTTHWAATSGGAGGQSVPGSADTVTFDGSSGGGTITLGYDPTVISITMGAFTGTFDASTFSPTMNTFSGTGTGTRTIDMGSGTWTLKGNNATIWALGTITNLTFIRGNAIVSDYAGSTGTRTINHTDTGESTCPSFNFTAGTDIVNLVSTRLLNVDFTGFSGTLNTGVFVLYGNLTMATGMVVTDTANGITLAPTSGTKTITSNGVLFKRPFAFGGVGSGSVTFSLADDFALNGTNKTMTLTAGTLDTNNNNVTCGLFATANSNVRTINMGSGTWTLEGTGNVWNLNTVTNLTLNPGTSTIKITDVSASNINFIGGGETVNNLWWARGAATGSNTIIHANTFNDFKDDGSVAHTIIFPNSTTTVTTFSVSGSAGNLITLARTGASGSFTLSKASGTVNSDYLSISNSDAIGGASWYAGANSTNGGNNTGWIFTAPPYGNFLMFM